MATFHMSQIVCECKNVSLGEIVYAIQENNAKDINELSTLTDAATLCKRCISKENDFGIPKRKLYLEDILEKLNG